MKEKGSVTIIVITTIFFLLIILGTIFTTMSFKRKSQLAELEQLKEAYDGDMGEVYEAKKSKGTYDEDKKVNAPSLKQGMTPVKFVGGNIIKTTEADNEWFDYEEQKWANAQTEDGSLWVWIPRYAYQVQYYTSSNLTTPSNTKTQYGKMDIKFLIDTTDQYYNDQGEKETAKRCTSVDEIVDTTTGYTVHPAFANESGVGYRNGGWSSELSGIWVAKFEAGYANATNDGEDTLNGVKVRSSDNKNTAPIKASSVNYSNYGGVVWAPTIEVKTENPDATAVASITARNWQDGVYGSTQTAIKYPTFQGSTYSMNYINHSESYLISSKLTEEGNIYGFRSDSNSHLMKNSEWGAVAYLAQSDYGFIGAGNTDIAINNKNLNNGGVSTTYEDGNKKASVYAVTGYNNANKEWNNGGENASTTSNIYGVYDMSGGLWERTPAYVANGNINLSRYGGAIAYDGNTQKTTSTPTTTVYPVSGSGTENEISQASWEANTKIYGDGVYETSLAGTGNENWNSDYSDFPTTSTPLFQRGGDYWDGGSAGVFAFYRSSGGSSYHHGFRPVVV